MFTWLRDLFASNFDRAATKHTNLRKHLRAAPRRRTLLYCEPLENRMLPAVTVGPNINVSQTAVSEQENAIIINPTNPSNLFATSTSGGVIAGGLGYAYSLDAGVTWQTSDASALLSTGGDQQMAWDSFGNLFLVQLSVSGGNVVTTVGLSTDGGATFSLILNTGSFGDQPSIAVGNNSVWVDYNVSGTMIAQGAAITGLGAVASFGSAQQPSGLTGTFGDIAVGPNGQVMMVYQEQNGSTGPAANAPSEIYYSLDPDGLGPQGFTDTATILTTNVGSFDAIPNQPTRTIGAEANLAWDRTNGARRGRVYMVYTEETPDESDDTEIMVRFSDDNGTTWSNPVRVNDDPTGNGKSQFNPAIALDQTTGNVAVTWYDARNSPGNNTAEVWGSISRDGGVTWEANVKISAGMTNTQVSAAQGFDFGDYDKMDFHAGVFYRAWTDNSNSTGDNPAGANDELDLYIAAVTVPSGTIGGGGGGGGVGTGGTVRLFNPVRFRKHKQAHFFRGLMSIVNYSGSAVNGPIFVIFKKLPAGVEVLNASGRTADGKPFIKLNRGLNPKKSFTFGLRVSNPLRKHLDNFFQTRHLRFTTTDPTA